MHKSDFKEWSCYTVIHPTDLLTEISVLSSDFSDYLFHTNSLETWLLEVIYLNHKSSLLLSAWLHGIWASYGVFLEDTLYYMASVNRMSLFLWPRSLVDLCSFHVTPNSVMQSIRESWMPPQIINHTEDYSIVCMGLWFSTPDRAKASDNLSTSLKFLDVSNGTKVWKIRSLWRFNLFMNILPSGKTVWIVSSRFPYYLQRSLFMTGIYW